MRLLLFAPSYARVAKALDAFASQIDLYVMDAKGRVEHAGRPAALDAVRPEAGWASVETFLAEGGQAYTAALLNSPDLKWVQSELAGLDHKLFSQFLEKGVTLTTSHGQAVGMAEYVFWGVLDHFQGGPARRRAQADRVWKQKPYREISGANWLLVGFGAIGQGVAARARAFGAHVTGIRRSPAPHPDADRIATLKDLPDLLPDADIVVLCCPLTDETRHLADARFFSAMKPGAMFVNVGRGGLVDEPALIAGLEGGVPEHALLDVFETEPLPQDSPFWTHPRVTVTAHTAGVCSGYAARNEALFMENLRRYLAGGPLLHEAAPAA